MQPFEPFADDRNVIKTYTCNVAPRSINAGYKPRFHRISPSYEYNRNACRSSLGCLRCREVANNGRHVKIDELTGKLRQSFWSALRPPGLNRKFIGGIARLTQ